MIPVVESNSQTFAEDLVDACTTIGFVSITDHEIDPTMFTQMRGLLKQLFDVDDDVKTGGAITRDNYRGFIPLGFFTPNRTGANGTTASGTGGDQYEGYKLHWECPPGHQVAGECALYGPNRWIAELPEMREIVLAYFDACSRVAARLLAVFADYLGVDRETFGNWHEAPLTNMTLLHYPAQPPADAATGIHPHKDTNVITLLHPDPVGGLHVRTSDGSWIEAVPPPDALLVNIGEMLELWSGGRLVATPHRVINSSGLERYAFPYFVVPNHQVVVEPLVPSVEGFAGTAMPVGPLSAEVWRTNWPDEEPSAADFDLGTLDR